MSKSYTGFDGCWLMNFLSNFEYWLTCVGRPDRCDGTFDASCDSTRAYTNISAIIKSFGKTELLSYMQTYWKDYSGNDDSFWSHEWSKHGTCIRYVSKISEGCEVGKSGLEE